MIGYIALYFAILHYKQLEVEECLDIAFSIIRGEDELESSVRIVTVAMLKEIIINLDKIRKIHKLESKMKVDRRTMVKLYMVCKLFKQMECQDYQDVIEMVDEGLSIGLLAQIAHMKDNSIIRALKLLRR